MASTYIIFLLFVTVLQLSSADEDRESRKVPERYLNIPEKIIGGVIDIVQNHKNKQPYIQASYQQGYQINQGGNYQNNNQNQGYQQWNNNNQNTQLQGQLSATQGGQGFVQIGNNQGSYPINQQPNYQGQTQIQIANQQSNNQFQTQNQQSGNQFQNQIQSNQFQNQNQIQTSNRFDNGIFNQQTGQYPIVNQPSRPHYEGGNTGYGQYQTGNVQGTFQNVNQQVSTQYPAAQKPVAPITQYPTVSQTGGQYQGSLQTSNQENYYQGSYGNGNYQTSQASTTGQYQNGSQLNQGSSQSGGAGSGHSGSGPGPTCICQAWTKPLSDEPVEQQYTPAPKLDQSFEPTTLLM